MLRTLIFLLTAAMTSCAYAAPDTNADEPPATPVVTTVGGREVRAAVTQDGHDVALTVLGNKQVVHVGLPQAGIVSEIRIAKWMNIGIVLGIEKRNPETNQRSYYWSTARVGATDENETKIQEPNVSLFLLSKDDYNLVGVANTQSDSICVTLLRHERGDAAQSFKGFLFVHNCPVASGLEGALHTFEIPGN